MDKIKTYFDHNGNVLYVEGEYLFANYPVSDLDFEYNGKIGAIDFETFGQGGLGSQSVYAGGWATKEFSDYIYIEKNADPILVVQRVIRSILANDKLNGFTFFAHNLGRFYALFLIKAAVSMEDIKIYPNWKDNTIYSMTIKDTKTNIKIKLLDSLLFVQGNLRDILKSYNCEVQKDYFPYKIVN